MSAKFVTSSGGGYVPPHLRSATSASPTPVAPVASAAPSYLPPHLRKEAEKKPQTSVAVSDARLFPELGGGKTKATIAAEKKANFWSSMISFKETVTQMIEKEKISEIEREAQRKKDREKDAWAVLPLKFDKERYILFNERMLGIKRIEQQVNDLVNQGMYVEQKLDGELIFNDSDVEAFSVTTDSYSENLEDDRMDTEEEEEYATN